MYEAHMEIERINMEADYHRTAWAVSHMMNATGNYKQRISPEKLLGKSEQPRIERLDPEEKKRALDDLKKKFDQ
jgi:hypothetical protein